MEVFNHGYSFKVKQLDDLAACSSLVILNMGPVYIWPEVGSKKGIAVKLYEPDGFFQMFDNLFSKEDDEGRPIKDVHGNPVDKFHRLIRTGGNYRPYMFGFFIFYCANDQIDTTGKFLESIGCTVQKTKAAKTGSSVAIYVIESGKFLDHYEAWMDEKKKEGYQCLGTKRW